MSINGGQVSLYEDLKKLYAADNHVLAASLASDLPINLDQKIDDYIRFKTSYFPALFFTPMRYRKEVIQEAVKSIAGHIFYSLDQDKRKQIVQKMWTHAGCPLGDGPYWREQQALHDVPLLLQVLGESLANDTPCLNRLGSNSPYENLLQLYECPLRFAKEHSLYTLRYDIRQELFYQIWDLDGRPPQIRRGEYGEIKVFDSFPRLQEAIRRIAIIQFSLLSERKKNDVISQIRLFSTEDDQHNPLDNTPLLLTAMATFPYLSAETKEAIDAWVAQGHLDGMEEHHREGIIEIMHCIELSPKHDRQKLIRFVNGLGNALVHYWKLLREIQAQVATSPEVFADSIPDHFLIPSGISQEEEEFYQFEFNTYSNGRIFYTIHHIDSVPVRDCPFTKVNDVFCVLQTICNIYLARKKELDVRIALDDYMLANLTLLDSCPRLLPQERGIDSNYISQEVIDSIDAFLAQMGNRLMPHEIGVLRHAGNHLFGAQAFSMTAHNDLQNAVDEVWEQLANLPDGGSFLLPGKAASHAFFFEIRREHEKNVVTIINTGADEESLEKRDFQKDDQERGILDSHKKHRYAHKAYRCDRGVLSKEFISSILSDLARTIRMENLLEQIDQSMKDLGAVEELGRLHHEQGGGSCNYKRCTSWLKGWLIHELGEIPGNALYARYKLFRTASASKVIHQFEPEMKVSDQNRLKVLYRFYSDVEFERNLQTREKQMQAVFKKRRVKVEHFDSLLLEQFANSIATI